MNFTIKGEHDRHFELLGDTTTTPLGRLDYKKWFSIRAEISVDGTTYQVAPAGVFQTTVEIKSGDALIGKLKFNWKGQIVISYENGPTYLFKSVGFLNHHFGLFTEHDHEIIALKQHFKLAQLSYNYTAEADDNYKEAQDPALLLLMIYCANYLYLAGAGAAG